MERHGDTVALDRRVRTETKLGEEARAGRGGGGQAGDFYTKLGYSIYGTLEDFPKGNSLFYLRKNLE